MIKSGGYGTTWYMSLGKYIKAVRRRRGISQWELSKLSGLTRSHISRLELDDYDNPTAGTFILLAKALKVHPNELYQAAGYIEENTRFRKGPPKTLYEAVAGLEVQSVNIPVTADVGQLTSGVIDVGQFATWGLPNNGSQNVKGLLVRGFSLEPDIREGDVIFIDPDTQPSHGSIVLCFQGEAINLVRYHHNPASDDSSDATCQFYGTVIGINRRLP
jgi:transcriptional regulator with XRE-family HTH domain